MSSLHIPAKDVVVLQFLVHGAVLATDDDERPAVVLDLATAIEPEPRRRELLGDEGGIHPHGDASHAGALVVVQRVHHLRVGGVGCVEVLLEHYAVYVFHLRRNDFVVLTVGGEAVVQWT